jgi:hypothetical protein
MPKYLISSFTGDIFHDNPYHQYEVSKNLTNIYNKYGKPTVNHILTNTPMDSAEIIDMNYYIIPDDSEFNLVDTCLTIEQINDILKQESEKTESDTDITEKNLIQDIDYSECQNHFDKKSLEISYYKTKINEIISKTSNVSRPKDYDKPKDNKILSNTRKNNIIKFHKNIRTKYINLLKNGTYIYFLVYFDKDITSNFNGELDNNHMFYNKKTKLDWTNIEFEFLNSKGTHFKIFDSIDSCIQYVDNHIILNNDKYDISNIFFSKTNWDKEFVFTMNINTEIWIQKDKYKTMFSPYRFSHNRFYKDTFVFVENIKTKDYLIQVYNTDKPSEDLSHHMIIKHYIPIDKTNKEIKYYNYTYKPNTTLGDISKLNNKYELIHLK